jgi:hypothetical protein
MPSRSYEFIQLDVFTQRALEGNPLAVFPDARGLSDAEMQALAREMNLSETTFILPRDAQLKTGRERKSEYSRSSGIAVRRSSDPGHCAALIRV